MMCRPVCSGREKNSGISDAGGGDWIISTYGIATRAPLHSAGVSPKGLNPPCLHLIIVKRLLSNDPEGSLMSRSQMPSERQRIVVIREAMHWLAGRLVLHDKQMG